MFVALFINSNATIKQRTLGIDVRILGIANNKHYISNQLLFRNLSDHFYLDESATNYLTVH